MKNILQCGIFFLLVKLLHCSKRGGFMKAFFDFLKKLRGSETERSYDEIMEDIQIKLQKVNAERVKNNQEPFETAEEWIYGVKHLEFPERKISPEERQELIDQCTKKMQTER